jgi:ferric-dicitrate binding protein FerR (iron transport regulator)
MFRRVTFTRTVQVLLAAATLVVSATPALAQDFAAKVIELTGRVSVMRQGAPWALEVGGTVQPKQVVITGPDGFARFQVSGGSTFEVFPSSKVVFRDNPPNWKDLLDVFIGRVRIHIEKLNGLPNRNRVVTPTAVISVRGTTFDVAIEDVDDTTLISVEEGLVEVEHRLAPGRGVLLNTGEWLRVFRNQPLAQRQVDRGAVVQRAMRAAAQAFYDLILRRPGASGGGTAGTGGGVPTPSGTGQGDRDKPGDGGSAPPPPPPPPPQ